MIVDQHQPVVEKYYGAGKMTIVVRRLLEECDRVTKGLIYSWEEDRSVKRKVCQFKLGKVVFLLQPLKLSEISNNQPVPLYSSSGRRQPNPGQTDDPVVDPREIDRVLSEVAGMVGRWNLFKKFLSEALKVIVLTMSVVSRLKLNNS